MTGNIALDIAIGLVFVFVLYSLLASIIAEIIATFFGLRARNLKTGIQRLLDEENNGVIPYFNVNIPFLHKIVDYINDLIAPVVKIFEGEEKKSAVTRFYKHPAIKYMAKDKFFSKPSYIPAGSFSKVVMDILKEGEGESALEKIQDSLKKLEENSAKIEELKQSLKKNPTDPASIKKEIRALEEASFLHGETLKLVTSYLDDVNNDLDKFKTKLESWFNDTMDRVAGWYKRKNQFILLVIGMVIAWCANVNTIEISKRLAKDDDARTQMVNLATSFVEENPDLVNRIETLKAGDSTDTNLHLEVEALNARLDTLISIKKHLQNDIDQASGVLGLSIPDSLEAQRVFKCRRRHVADTMHLNQVFVNDSLYLVTFPNEYMAQNAGKHFEVDTESLRCGQKKVYAHLKCWSYFWANFLGYLITALAISLGAPFWFDLLNKLVKLRNSTRPDAPSGGGSSSAATPKQNKPDIPVG